MFVIRDMRPEDRAAVLALAREFYMSDAVDHDVPGVILERVFEDALSQDPVLRGLVLMESEEIVGFAYLTMYYACEVGGLTLMIEEIYMKDSCRGKGYGSRFFTWMFEHYPQVCRFRLEVTKENEKAVKLYERIGFRKISYDQMVLDR